MAKPLRVLFDASPLIGNRSGVGIYTQGLVDALERYHGEQFELTGFYFNFLGRKKIDFQSLPSTVKLKPIHFFPGIFLPLLARRFGFQIPVEFLVFKKYDVHLFTNFISLPTLRKTPQVITVHDLGCFDFPEFVQDKNLVYLQKLLPSSIRRAAKILTISNFTKKRVLHYSHRTSSDIQVAHIPPEPTLESIKLAEGLKKFDLQKGHYILYVGTIEPRKNLIQLIKAYALLPEELLVQYPLVLAGSIGWKHEGIMNAVDEARLAGCKIIMTGYFSNLEKAALYTYGSIFVLPSHYEGFGMPVLEAMSYKIPVLLSDIEVFHEVAGNAALYANKDDVFELSRIMVKVLESKKIRSQLVHAGDEHLKKYSWKHVADTVCSMLMDVARNDNSS